MTAPLASCWVLMHAAQGAISPLQRSCAAPLHAACHNHCASIEMWQRARAPACALLRTLTGLLLAAAAARALHAAQAMSEEDKAELRSRLDVADKVLERLQKHHSAGEPLTHAE